MKHVPSKDDIRAAHRLIENHIRKTPIFQIDSSAFDHEGHISLKLEMLQYAGSFKARGAFYNLLSRNIPPAGVAAASGGNHGAAVAYAASRLGIPARIFVPEISSPAKIAKIRACGAKVVVKGARYADALELCLAYQQETGAEGLHAYDSFETICGQGTLGLELETQMKENLPDTLLVAVGGGGLISGITSWFGKNIKIIGVEPEKASALYQAHNAGKPVDVEVSGIAADSLGAKRCGELVYQITSDQLHDLIRIEDSAILDAQKLLWTDYRLACEAGGSAALAALSSGAYKPAKGERVSIILCGSNVQLDELAALAAQL